MAIIDISRTLDERTAVYPGDIPLSRSATMRIAGGDLCNVTAFTASAHAGTHADMPVHIREGAPEFSLDTYVGPCVVVAAGDWGSLPDIEPRLRVLFKTKNSWTPTDCFDPGFDYPPGHAIEWLIERQALLVGMDGPSVDAPDSPDLPNHRRLCDAWIAIIENLDLSAVDPGRYELIALPLRIPGADATWVRAVLRTP